MKKIAALIIVASFGLAGCSEEKPTDPTPKAEQKTGDAQRRLMYIAPREMPVPKPYKKGDVGDSYSKQ